MRSYPGTRVHVRSCANPRGLLKIGHIADWVANECNTWLVPHVTRDFRCDVRLLSHVLQGLEMLPTRLRGVVLLQAHKWIKEYR